MRWCEPSPAFSRRAPSALLVIAAAWLLVCVAAPGCHRAPPAPHVRVRPPLREAVYRVQPGDTIERIAAWYGVPAGTLRTLNDLDTEETLAPGVKLRVPARPLPTYLVEPGDTLGRLAQSFGVELDALARLNAIDDPRRLAVGTVLRIPATAKRTEIARSNIPRREAPSVATAPPVAAPNIASPPPAESGPGPSTPAAAGSDADEALSSAEHAFEDAHFEEALDWTERAQEALPPSSANAADQQRLARVHLVRGMTEVALGRDAEARQSFGRALALDGGIELDPAEVSPKVLSVFREVRGH